MSRHASCCRAVPSGAAGPPAGTAAPPEPLASAASPAASSALAITGGTTAHVLRVLLADDVKTNRKLLRIALTRHCAGLLSPGTPWEIVEAETAEDE